MRFRHARTGWQIAPGGWTIKFINASCLSFTVGIVIVSWIKVVDTLGSSPSFSDCRSFEHKTLGLSLRFWNVEWDVRKQPFTLILTAFRGSVRSLAGGRGGQFLLLLDSLTGVIAKGGPKTGAGPNWSHANAKSSPAMAIRGRSKRLALDFGLGPHSFGVSSL